jgi:hypothetical protein
LLLSDCPFPCRFVLFFVRPIASQEVDDQIFQVLAEKQQLLQEQVRNLAVPRSKWKMDLICQLFSE